MHSPHLKGCKLNADSVRPVNAVLLSLYSKRYPAIGESHGLSVVAGALADALPTDQLRMRVLDMVEWGIEDSEKAVAHICELQANVLAIGLPYGTFRIFQKEYPAMRSALHGENPLIVLGGPVATYLSHRILHEIAQNAVVIVGEAEEALPLVVQAWLNGQPMAGIHNLHYIDQSTGEDVRTPRRLADFASPPLPYRSHIAPIRAKGGQIYVESSRGCSWAACTFCLRGLTDIEGRSYEYRRKPARIVAADLKTLSELGVTEVTFADEDFLGNSLTDAEKFIDALEENDIPFPRFDVSLTVHSVYSRRDTPAERGLRERLLAKLAGMGLQKVFLGIESCSPSQLKRYAKGHTREEAACAVRVLQRLGIRVEIGFILFDPLCTLDEVAESLRFLQDSDLVRLASWTSGELRLQDGSYYMTLLRNHERRHNVKIHCEDLDPDTISYQYAFADKSVQHFFNMVTAWNTRMIPVYYPAKNLSRYGATGAIGDAAHPLREAAERFREESCDALLKSILVIKSGGDGEAMLDQLLGTATRSLAQALLRSISVLTPTQSEHPVVQQAAAEAAYFLNRSDSPLHDQLT